VTEKRTEKYMMEGRAQAKVVSTKRPRQKEKSRESKQLGLLLVGRKVGGCTKITKKHLQVEKIGKATVG